jgi:uncharacterized membrane protein YvbJ
MALGTCRECGKQVAEDAPTCPQCGTTNPAPTTRGTVKREAGSLLKWIGIGIAIAVAVNLLIRLE